MVSEDPHKTYETFKNEGNEKFKAKDYVGAAACYTKAIVVKKDEPIAYSNRALCYFNLKRYFQAKEDCDKAIELDPTFTKAYYRRAISLRELSRFRSALSDFQEVFSLDPNFTLAQKEIDSIQDLLKNDTRMDLKTYDKPSNFRSDKPVKTFQLKNQYSGTKLY